MPRYKWNNPREWFDKFLKDVCENRRTTTLKSLAVDFADRLDFDSLQELFEQEMEYDGYFLDLDEMCVCGHIREHHFDWQEDCIHEDGDRICECECFIPAPKEGR